MENIKSSVENDILNKRNVVGIGLGQKWTKGQNTGEDSILVFVEQKKSTSQLSNKDLIPDTIDGIKTDVVGKSGIFTAKDVYTGKIRPIQPGYSCGHYKITAGTIGAFFRDWQGDVVGLSNNHVLANINNCRNNIDSIVQPGVYDDRSWSGNVVGKLKRFRRLALTSRSRAYNHADRKHMWGYNMEDSAIFKPSDGVEIDTEIPHIGSITDFNDTVTIGETLRKTGRTTGYTNAKVIASSMTVMVNYGRYNVKFKDQIATNYMSDGGDSGSITVNAANEAVGLLFAGSPSITLHNRIRYPRASFGLTVINDNPIVTNFTYQLVVDNVVQPDTFKQSEFEDGIALVRKLAREGKTAEITMAYNAQPE